MKFRTVYVDVRASPVYSIGIWIHRGDGVFALKFSSIPANVYFFGTAPVPYLRIRAPSQNARYLYIPNIQARGLDQ